MRVHRIIVSRPDILPCSSVWYPSYRFVSSRLGLQSLPHILARRLDRSPKRQMSSQAFDLEHFYRYTSGRWVWDEESQLRQRYTTFNVPELKQLAAKSVGAGACVEISKLAEGSFNKVFRLVMDNGKTAIALIPNPNAGPAFYTTASEVATMDFVCDRIPRLIGLQGIFPAILYSLTDIAGSHSAPCPCS